MKPEHHSPVDQKKEWVRGSDDEAMLEMFQEVKVQRPADVILSQIRDLSRSGKLRPGDKLPSERVLASRFQVGPSQVREALKKLDFYGIVETAPNRGTTVASLGVKALEGLISTILRIDQDDLSSLFDTRQVLEVFSAEKAALNATDEDITELTELHADFVRQVSANKRALEEDHLFHLKIAESSKNSIMSSLIGLITPDIIAMSRNVDSSRVSGLDTTVEEHSSILASITKRDAEAAREAMRYHMDMSRERRFGTG